MMFKAKTAHSFSTHLSVFPFLARVQNKEYRLPKVIPGQFAESLAQTGTGLIPNLLTLITRWKSRIPQRDASGKVRDDQKSLKTTFSNLNKINTFSDATP